VSAIPRTFHRVFMDDPIPERYEEFWRMLRALHPGWRFVTWDSSEEVRAWMPCRTEFDRARTWAGKSDVARYAILARYGGVYVDTDVEPLRAFDELLRDPRPFCGWEDENLLCPTVMGSPPGHPAMAALLQALPGWARLRRRLPPNKQTGPHFLTAQWRNRTDVRLLPPRAFYPVGWWEKAKLGGPYPPESFSVHHWDAGWLPNGPPQQAAHS